MGKVEEVLKSEMLRLVKKATKGTLNSLSKDVRYLKRSGTRLSKTVATLEKKIAKYEQLEQAQKAKLDATEEEAKASRFSPSLVKNLRKRLGITQSELALLSGVSKSAVVTWEGGVSAPRAENKKTLVALRKLGRRDVKKLLSEKKKVKPKRKPAKKKATQRKGAKKKATKKRTAKTRKRKK